MGTEFSLPHVMLCIYLARNTSTSSFISYHPPMTNVGWEHILKSFGPAKYDFLNIVDYNVQNVDKTHCKLFLAHVWGFGLLQQQQDISKLEKLLLEREFTDPLL